MKFEHYQELNKHPLTLEPVLRLECMYKVVNQTNIELGANQITEGDIAELKVNMENQLRAGIERELTSETEFDVIRLGLGELNHIVQALGLLVLDEKMRFNPNTTSLIHRKMQELDKLSLRFIDMEYKMKERRYKK